MRELEARDVDIPAAARLVRADQRVGAIAQLLLEIGDRETRVTGDRPLPELPGDQAVEQRRAGAAEIASEGQARERERERDRCCAPSNLKQIML